jgi:hypothetical protein
MVDWTNGKPNARYWVLKLVKNNFGPGDTLLGTVFTDAAANVESMESCCRRLPPRLTARQRVRESCFL